MELSDIGQVVRIEKACFSIPWTEHMLQEGLHSRIDYYWIYEDTDVAAGYLNLRVIAGEGELNRIAILPSCQGRGGAKKLMDMLTDFTINNGINDLTLEVRESNIRAINLYKSYGFAEEVVRKDYYSNPLENAIIMWRRFEIQ